jgi:hypothetical protein
MSHKRQGQLAVSGEWARHLRPFLRRMFWKSERQAVLSEFRQHPGVAGAERSSSCRVEELLKRIDQLPAGARTLDLYVPEHPTYKDELVASDVAVTMLAEVLFERGLIQRGFKQQAGGRTYRFELDAESNSD